MFESAWSVLTSVGAAALAQVDAGAEEASRGGVLLERGLLPAAMLLGAIGVWLMLSRRTRKGRALGGAAALLGFGILGWTQAAVGGWFVSSLYWMMAGATVIAAGGTITARSPVYSAVFFAVTLLGVAGLFLLAGAQFLSIATVAVYAGAIVVTFLFVVMLAQPEGHAYYDRLSWGRLPPLAAAAAAALLIGGVAYAAEALAGLTPPAAAAANPVLVRNHMAHLGRELFSVHLIAIEIAGVLLLAALVGALAIVIQGRDPVIRRSEYEPADEAQAGPQPDRVGARRLQPVGGDSRE